MKIHSYQFSKFEKSTSMVLKTIFALIFTNLISTTLIAQKGNNCGSFKIQEVAIFTDPSSTITINDGNFSLKNGDDFKSIIKIKRLKDLPAKDINMKALDKLGKPVDAKLINIATSFDEKTEEITATISKTGSKESEDLLITGIILIMKDNCNNEIEQTVEFFSANETVSLLINGTKRPAKYGQCMVFSKTVGDNNIDSNKFVKLDSIQIHNSVTYDKSNDISLIECLVEIGFENEKGVDIVQSMMVWGDIRWSGRIRYNDKNSQTKTMELKQVYDSKLQKLVLKGSLSMGGTITQMASAIQYKITNSCGNTDSLDAQYVRGFIKSDKTSSDWTEIWVATQKIKKKKEKYKFSKVRVIAAHMNDQGYLKAQVELKEGSSIPASMEMIVGITNCDNKTEYISVSMKYESKTGTWSGSSSLVYYKNCTIYLASAKIKIVNACGDKIESKTAYFDENTGEWVCEDECLKIGGDLTCGKTDHF